MASLTRLEGANGLVSAFRSWWLRPSTTALLDLIFKVTLVASVALVIAGKLFATPILFQLGLACYLTAGVSYLLSQVQEHARMNDILSRLRRE